MKVIRVKDDFKCECGCKTASVINFKNLLVVCSSCGRIIDNSLITIEDDNSEE